MENICAEVDLDLKENYLKHKIDEVLRNRNEHYFHQYVEELKRIQKLRNKVEALA